MPSISAKYPEHSTTLVAREKPEAGSLRHHVLHILDHSHPLLSGYSVRSHNLIRAQKAIGFVSDALTGPLHQLENPESTDATIDEVSYQRTPLQRGVTRYILDRRVPVLREM